MSIAHFPAVGLADCTSQGAVVPSRFLLVPGLFSSSCLHKIYLFGYSHLFILLPVTLLEKRQEKLNLEMIEEVGITADHMQNTFSPVSSVQRCQPF